MRSILKIFLLMFISMGAYLSAELKSADFRSMDCYEYTDAVQNAARLNAQLVYRPENYLNMKGYPKCDVGAFGSMMFAHCFIERETNKVHIILYFENFCPRHEDSASDSLIKEREMFAHRIQQVILSLCREFIYKDLDPSSLIITAKHDRHLDIDDENLLFIWDGNDVKYFPLLFEANIMEVEPPFSKQQSLK